MSSDPDFETVFETEAELRALEADLDRQRRDLRTELTAAFRRLHGETLHDAADREYPFTQPEKRAVRRETVGPVELLPEWEAAYRDLAADQRTARERLAAFHRDVFTDLAADQPYSLTVETNAARLDRPYLDLWVRGEAAVVGLEVDNPLTEGYAYRTDRDYSEQDVQNGLQLLSGLADIDIDRFGFLVHDTALVDEDDVRVDTDDPEQLRAHVQVEILDGLAAVDYEFIETEDSPVLAFLEAVEAYGLGGK